MATQDRPQVTIHPVPDRYAIAGETTIEVTSSSGGALISIRDDGQLVFIEVYRADPAVRVLHDNC